MTPTPLQIIIPVRNPGAVFAQTVSSLCAQTDRRFCVLISDNWSTKGMEHLDQAQQELSAAGIAVTRIKPPRELKRVEHWNWAHAQGQCEWLKPLFVGDLLQPLYVERVNARIHAGTKASIIRCLFESRSPESSVVVNTPFTDTYVSPAGFLSYFPLMGNWLGGPINVCYRANAWRALGGYLVHLPACADYGLYVRMVLLGGIEVIHENLATFQLHDQRFSHGIAKRRVNGSVELWVILRQARSDCLSRNLPWASNALWKTMWQQIKSQYWHPVKSWIKQRLLKR